ncbi:MAG: hypothetical protein ACK5YE_18585, partial [Planctomyces sp.]
MGLRVALVGLIAVVLMEPALLREEETNEERTIAVLVDASGSMSLPVRSGINPQQSRSEVAASLLGSVDDPAGGLLARIQDGYALRVYEFGAAARELSIDNAFKVQPKVAVSNPDAGAAEPAALRSHWADSTDVAAALR